MITRRTMLRHYLSAIASLPFFGFVKPVPQTNRSTFHRGIVILSPGSFRWITRQERETILIDGKAIEIDVTRSYLVVSNAV